MSKSILVVDTPKNCEQCCFCKGLNVCQVKKMLENDGVFTVYTVDKQIMDGTKPDWCPLNPIPEKDPNSYFPDEYSDGYKDGHNACIDEIISSISRGGEHGI